MTKEILNGVAKLYSDNAKAFGASPRSAGWKDMKSQELRFAKLLEVIRHADTRAELSINDLGCGYGVLYRYMKTSFALNIAKYYGYDISSEMLALARNQASEQGVEFINSERILCEADYSVASGIFNVKLEVDDPTWQAYTTETLVNMNEKSLRGFSFNALTTYVDYREPHLYYADPLFFFDFCKRNFSPRVSLLHDYGLYEWTIIVRRC